MRDRLKTIRKNTGMSTYEVAAKIKISQSYYSSIENGTRENIYRFCYPKKSVKF